MKKKTIFACSVKLLLCISTVQAQTVHDSAKHNITITPIIFNNYYPAPVYKNSVAGDYYAKQLPFFCNKELKVQKAVGFPVKLRLGSVEYCDKLEGKNK